MQTDRIHCECSVAGCTRKKRARGLCSMHYSRWAAHGDPLKRLRPANGEAQVFFEDAVLKYALDDCLIWPFKRDKEGYGRLYNIPRKRMDIASRMACERVHGPPPTSAHEAAHSCGNGSGGCVNPRHLAWSTRLENEGDKTAHGTAPRGARNHSAKLTLAQITEMRQMKGRATQAEIARRFGVSQSHVSDILSGKKWGWVE